MMLFILHLSNMIVPALVAFLALAQYANAAAVFAHFMVYLSSFAF
jgi:hypothetical protein